MRRRVFLAASAATALWQGAAGSPASAAARKGLRLVDDEAKAVLAILARRARAQPVEPARWSALFATEGFRRLSERQHAFRDPFPPETFKAFVESPALLDQRQALAQALRRFHAAGLQACGRRALAYLPPGSVLDAAVYPVVKPQSNSFAYDLEHQAALFLSLHTDYSTARFAATLAHELFHVGFAQNCPPAAIRPQIEALPAQRKLLFDWMVGGFGEGLAVLAAAGGPDVDPASVAPANAAPEWAEASKTFASRMDQLTGFFRRLLSGELDAETSDEPGSALLGVQGPWYTVGWRVAVTIEKGLGRPALVDCIADMRKLLPAYNRLAPAAGLPPWPADVADAFAP